MNTNHQESLAFHPLAEIFPTLIGPEFDAFVADIRDNGLREPIVLFDGQILDGRNRFRACEAANIEPRFEIYEGDDPVGYVISLNLRRRHLDESQRGMVAARLANIPAGTFHGNQHVVAANLPPASTPDDEDGADTDSWDSVFAQAGVAREAAPAPVAPVSQSQAASMLNVSERTVRAAVKVKDEGAPELVAAVDQGVVSVSAAADVATLPKPRQVEIVARGEREILQVAKEIRAGKAEAKREERIAKIAEIAKGNEELETSRSYPVIYADPPWRYENPPMGGTNRSIENHYPTMSLDEICALPVRDLATEDAILYLWATAPKLAECLKVIEAWGFEYRTHFVWVKDKIGMGYHARNQHELLLVAKRGNIPPPAIADRVSSVVYAERAEHSEKPAEFYDLIESFYPSLPKIELFSRAPRDGWAAWGNQARAA